MCWLIYLTRSGFNIFDDIDEALADIKVSDMNTLVDSL